VLWKVTERDQSAASNRVKVSIPVKEGHSLMPGNPSDRAEDAMAQIARLRDQVESLIRDRIAPAIEDAAGRAEAATASVRARADEVAGAVRHQPLTAIFVAAAVGFLLGRASR
jgi:ElaB/YqjD/DUF883 family membrane-anchored ribosome-binding protein